MVFYKGRIVFFKMLRGFILGNFVIGKVRRFRCRNLNVKIYDNVKVIV